MHRPKPRTKTDVVIAMIAVSVISKSRATCSLTGAIIEDDMGLINVNEETTKVAAHFRRYDQLQGHF